MPAYDMTETERGVKVHGITLNLAQFMIILNNKTTRNQMRLHFKESERHSMKRIKLISQANFHSLRFLKER